MPKGNLHECIEYLNISPSACTTTMKCVSDITIISEKFPNPICIDFIPQQKPELFVPQFIDILSGIIHAGKYVSVYTEDEHREITKSYLKSSLEEDLEYTLKKEKEIEFTALINNEPYSFSVTDVRTIKGHYLRTDLNPYRIAAKEVKFTCEAGLEHKAIMNKEMNYSTILNTHAHKGTYFLTPQPHKEHTLYCKRGMPFLISSDTIYLDTTPLNPKL
jgi:hypothetical protein